MDSIIIAAARALAAGDPLGALQRIALREDAAALALRGIAMAQLNDFARSKLLLRRAMRAFGPKEELARARCVIAKAEIAFASRDLTWQEKMLDAARATLAKHGDHINAAHARYLEIRRWVLLGELERAEQALAELDPQLLPAVLQATHALIEATIAMRRLKTGSARTALLKAEQAARETNIAALIAEVANTAQVLDAPAARIITNKNETVLRLKDVEDLFASDNFIIDACRYTVRVGAEVIALANRPVLFTLIRGLAQAWPEDVSRDELALRAFRLKRVDESVRARLRVEMGRLRTVLRSVADIRATARGFTLDPRHSNVVVMAPLVDDDHGDVLAMLADGESWSSSALALVLNSSQRTVQRALESLATAGKVQSFGYGRARRWTVTPIPGYATLLLLPTSAFSS